MNILLKVLQLQNTNFGQLFVSATHDQTAKFNPDMRIETVIVRFEVFTPDMLEKVSKLMFAEGFYFVSANTEFKEYTYKNSK